jgi:CheY-like chemotaxis protein
MRVLAVIHPPDATREILESMGLSARAPPVVPSHVQHAEVPEAGADNTAAGFAAGVTDYLTKPFRPGNVRARVQAWLLRRRSDAATPT